MTEKKALPIINFMTGTACNWHCKYCLQGKETGFDKKVDVQAFLKKFIPWFENYMDKMGFDHVDKFQFWGGEPLLYLDTIKQIHEGIKHYKYVRPTRIVTNGSLVDDEFVKWVNDNKIFVNVSYHDGQLSDEQWEKCLKIRNMIVTALIHHKRLNLDELRAKWQYIWDKWGRCTRWCIATIYAVDGVPTDYYLTKDDVDQWIKYLKEVVIPQAKTDPFYHHVLNLFVAIFAEFADYGPNDNPCYNKSIVSVDLRGNFYYCHHDVDKNTIAGNIFDPLSIWKELPPISDQCKKCDILHYCHGSCIRDNAHDVTCYLYREQYKVYKDVWENQHHLIDPQVFGHKFHG